MSDDATSAAQPQRPRRAPITVEVLLARYERIKERKREYMARRYTADPEFRAHKQADATRRYHERVPGARWGIRGRRPAAPATPGAASPTTDDIDSGASTPMTNGMARADSEA